MDDKLKLLLEKVNLDKKYYSYFKDGKIIKIIASKDKLNWNFIIETKELLPVEVIKYLDENIKNAFPNLDTVTYTIVPINKELLSINSYYPYIIDIIGLSSAMTTLFKEKTIKFKIS